MKQLIMLGVIAISFTSTPQHNINNHLEPLAYKLSEVTGFNPRISIYEVFGRLTFEMIERDQAGYSCWSTLKCYGLANLLEDPKADGLLIHELGHVFLNNLELSYNEIGMDISYYNDGTYVHVTGINLLTGRFERTTRGYLSSERPFIQHGELLPDFNTYQEDFADLEPIHDNGKLYWYLMSRGTDKLVPEFGPMYYTGQRSFPYSHKEVLAMFGYYLKD